MPVGQSHVLPLIRSLSALFHSSVSLCIRDFRTGIEMIIWIAINAESIASSAYNKRLSLVDALRTRASTPRPSSRDPSPLHPAVGRRMCNAEPRPSPGGEEPSKP